MTITKSLLKYLDFILFILFIILISRSSFYFLFSEESRFVLLYIIYIYFFGRIVFLYVFQNKKLNWSRAILAITLLIICSSLWSSNIIFSLNLAIVQILFSTLVITFFSNKYKLITVFKLTFIAGLIITISSYIIVFIRPALGIDSDGGDIGSWTGIFVHKNLLSVSICFHLIITIFLIISVRKKFLRIGYLIVAVLELLLILLSRSSTGIVALILALLVPLTLIYLIMLKNKFLLSSLITLYLIFLGLFIYELVISIDNITFAFGKDLTFSGRTIIWQAVIDLIKEKPFLGYGYGSFWIEGSFTQNYVSSFGVQQAHNGFLDIFTNIGWVGFIVFMSSFFIYIKRNLSLIICKKDKVYFFPLVYLVFFVIYNLQESYLIEQNFIMWSFYVYFYMLLSAERKKLWRSKK